MQAAGRQASYERLFRSRDACLGGVCAGIAERCDLDALVVRILAILLAACTFGLVAVVYGALWALLPRQPERPVPYDITPERAESVARGSLDCMPPASRGSGRRLGAESRLPIVLRLAIAAGLMLLFLAVATNAAPMVPGTRWWQFWPVAVLIVGLCLIVIPVRTEYEAAWHAAGIVTASLGAAMLPMSLGVVDWGTVPNAFAHLWPLVGAAIILFAVGTLRRFEALILAGALCFAAFCLLGLLAYTVQGDVGTLLVAMPDGRSLRIAFTGI